MSELHRRKGLSRRKGTVLRPAAGAMRAYVVKYWFNRASKQVEINSMSNPRGIGGFRPGQSGNAGGRPRRHISDLAKEARKFSRLALKTLIEICKDGTERGRLTAAQTILDRGFGRAVAMIDATLMGRKLSDLTGEELRALENRMLSDPLSDDAEAEQPDMFENPHTVQ
jgi:hypothetical protein